MMTKKLMTAALVAAFAMPALTACTTDGLLSDENIGTGLGAVAGGVIGSQFGGGSGQTVATAIGALAGAWAGSKIVQGMNAQDRGYYNTAANKATTAPVGQPITWYNPQSGSQGTITATREGRTSDGAACREYQQTVTIGGKTEKAYGTACKQADGSWKVMN
ncbi:MAG: glycine zipper 2TM domain-containing protein [Proteobacteria bacterium]|nr:glycine zipper 2TM domain-containing protein [Pseudomonadota bacterium]